MSAMRALLQHLLRAALVLTALCLAAQAQATCTSGACVVAGPRLASVDSSRGALINALVGRLLNSTVTVSAADWNALGSAQINLAKFLGALQTQTSTATPATALAASATLAQVINAAVTAAQADGNTAAVSALTNLGTAIGSIAGTIRVGDLLKVNLPDGMLANGSINVFDLIMGSIELFNYNNVAVTPTPVGLTGAQLGQSSLGSAQIYARVIEPPVMVCGPSGTQFHTATIRVKLNLNLVSIALNTSALVTGSIASVSANVATITLYLEIAKADGSIGTINALSNALTVQVTPGVSNLYLGSMDDNAFFTRSRAILASDLDYGTIGSIQVTLLSLITLGPVAITAKASAIGQAPFSSNLTFTGPYPQTRTATTSVNFTTNLLASLISSLDIKVNPIIGLDASGLGILKTLVANTLTSTLTPLMSSLVDPLVRTLGVQLGEADVTVNGVSSACSLAGYGYADGNHNATRDGGEVGCGVNLWAKLVPAASPSGPATQVVAIDASTGAYSFAAVPPGSYVLVMDNNATLSDVVSTGPSGWIGTQNSSGSLALTMPATDLLNQNFGLYNGSRVGGLVFKDTGTAGGTPNNATREAGELALAASTVKVTSADGTVVYDTAVSGGDGSFAVFVPATSTSTVRIAQTNLPGYMSVGAQVGNTAGAYVLAQDVITFTPSAGTLYTNVAFADVPVNVLAPDNAQTVLPGATVTYAHSFVAGTAGQVTFTLAGTAKPTLTWSSLLYQDSNCNGTLEVGEPVISAAVAVVADQRVCLIVKTTAPANAPLEAQYNQTLSVAMTYTNSAVTWSGTRADLTTVDSSTNAGLVLVKTVDKASAASGQTITYTITYVNRSSGALSNIRLNDMTPAYTNFSVAACGTLPTGVSCAVSQQPTAGAGGAVQWTLTGTLPPTGQGVVSFTVVVQ
ncbi:MAG: hypothetical protein QM639_13805 [Rhodocyclaceae bacterium]